MFESQFLSQLQPRVGILEYIYGGVQNSNLQGAHQGRQEVYSGFLLCVCVCVCADSRDTHTNLSMCVVLIFGIAVTSALGVHAYQHAAK